MASERFSLPQYLIRRKILKLFGGAFHIYVAAGNLVFYSKMAAFKLKEDIRLYTSEEMTDEVLTISARTMLDISTVYDVKDSKTGQKIGAIKRQGLKSIVRDTWLILDGMDNQIGTIQEDSTLMAMLRRLLSNLIPQKFHVEMNGSTVCTYQQNFNPFVLKLVADFTPDRAGIFDRRLGIAAGLLLGAIEGRQG
jgi:uncharacterized protein YxjI